MLGREVSRAVQKGDGGIDTNDLSSAFSKGERMLSMTTTDIDDTTGW